MKRGLILLFAFSFAFAFPLHANTFKPRSSADQLRKEVAAFFKSKDLTFLDKNVEMVSVSFLINAKNELVIFNVSGDDADACDYVKEVLNFQKVNYNSAKPLAKYEVDIRLEKE